jgi:hypothetical protein
MQFLQGFHFYREHDVLKVIYVFVKGDYGEGQRYYYFDLGERAIRSFAEDNEIFAKRCEAVEDIDSIKVYNMQLHNMLKWYQTVKPELIEVLKQRVA